MAAIKDDDNVHIESIGRVFSYSQGWVAEMKFVMLSSYVDTFVANYKDEPFPGTGLSTPVVVPALYPQQISSTPVNDSPVDDEGESTQSRVTLNFALDCRNVNWPSDITKPAHTSGTTLRLRGRYSGQFLTLPSKGVCAVPWYVAAPNSPIVNGLVPGFGKALPPPSPNANTRLLIPTQEFIVEWDRVRYHKTGLATLKALEGSVNSIAFMGQEPETLLLEGVDIEHSFILDNVDPWAFKITMTFKGRRILFPSEDVYGHPTTAVLGWNHEFHENPAGWVRMIMADGRNRYSLVDFTNIFNT
jgi:hypothetical protein